MATGRRPENQVSDDTVDERDAATTPGGLAMYDIVVATLSSFFRLRALGERTGAVSETGAGIWGLFRSLELGGPQTVPQLARARPVSRQHIQTMVNQLAENGLVELIDNPAHRRSKLVRLTDAGRARFSELDAKIKALAAELAIEIDEDDLATAARVMVALSVRLEKMLTEK